MAKKILVTGGAGYVGSHVVRQLRESGLEPLVFDNLSQGHCEALMGETCVVGELSDEGCLDQVFQANAIGAVMHLAGRCYVEESVLDPQLYYGENVGHALILLRVMLHHGVDRLVFSSSCATYGDPVRMPIDESHPQNPANPYGESKYFVERVLCEYARAYGLRTIFLRYFNAAGASLDGRLGESHHPETHLIPRILRVAQGREPHLDIYGDDYPTADGTCIRDYVHVMDLASAHVAALRRLDCSPCAEAFNLGSGRGHSVLEVVALAREISGRAIAVEIKPRRRGDPPQLVADAAKACSGLNWTARYSDLATIVRSAWEWECRRRY